MHSRFYAPLRSVLNMCHWHIAPYPLFAYRGIIIPLLCSYRGGSKSLSPTYDQAHVGLDLFPPGIIYYTIPWAVIAVAQGLSVYAVFAFICILLAYYQRSPFRFYTILHRFRLSVNMQMNRIRFCLRIPHNTNVFRCRLCSNHNTVPMIRLALKWLQFYRCRLQLSGTDC